MVKILFITLAYSVSRIWSFIIWDSADI